MRRTRQHASTDHPRPKVGPWRRWDSARLATLCPSHVPLSVHRAPAAWASLRRADILEVGSRAFWGLASGRGREPSVVAAGDPSIDSGDGLDGAFGCSPNVGHQLMERPERQVVGAPQETSSSKPRSIPALRLAAARSAYLAVQVLALGWAQSSGRCGFELERLLTARTACLIRAGSYITSWDSKVRTPVRTVPG